MIYAAYDAMSAQACACSDPECRALGCKIIRDRGRAIAREREYFRLGMLGALTQSGDVTIEGKK